MLLPRWRTAPPSGSGSATLRILDLEVRFGGVQALRQVGLNLAKGEVCAVVGSNGSGKTTLLNAISGFVRPNSGEIWAGDLSLHRLPAHARRGAGIGRAFQVPPILAGWTVGQYLATASYWAGAPPWYRSIAFPARSARRIRAEQDYAATGLARIGVGASLDAQLGEISLGELKLIDVVRAAIGADRLVMLDEPTSGLGLGEVDKLRAFVREIGNAGQSVIIVEHNLEFVADIADHVLVLDDGAVVAAGNPTEVFAEEAVRRSYMGDFARHGRLAGTSSPESVG